MYKMHIAFIRLLTYLNIYPFPHFLQDVSGNRKIRSKSMNLLRTMASMPLELGSSSLSSLRCWRRRPGQRPAHGKGRHVVEGSFSCWKRWKTKRKELKLFKVWRMEDISYSTVICLRLKPHHWIEVWQKLMSIFPRKVLNNKQSNHPSIDLFVPGYQHELRVTVSLSARHTRHSRWGAPRRIAAVNWSSGLRPWGPTKNIKNPRDDLWSLKHVREVEDPMWFFVGIKFQVKQGNAYRVVFVWHFLFGGKGIGNKIGLHEKCCALTCIAWLREWIS